MEIPHVRFLFIGAGPHTLRSVAQLLHQGVASLDEIAIVDPSPAPLFRFAEYLKDCNTKHLRSGKAEHCHADDDDLEKFCLNRQGCYARGDRPCVDVWLAHARSVIERFSVLSSYHQGWANWFNITERGVEVTTSVGMFLADHVIFATGMTRPFYPEWAARLRGRNEMITHIFDNDFEDSQLPDSESAVVIGSGITAAQVVDILEASGKRKVTLLTRRPLSQGEGRTSSMHWRERTLRSKLCSLATPGERDAMLRAEGDRGTMPAWEIERLHELMAKGRLEHVVAEVAHLSPLHHEVEIVLEGQTEPLRTGLVVLSTGFVPELQDWLVRAARKADLPFYPDGTPLLDQHFGWYRSENQKVGIYMTGRQAFRIAGPFAHNIIGGILLADSLCDQLLNG